MIAFLLFEKIWSKHVVRDRNYLKEVDYVQEQGVDLVLKRSPPEADELLFKTESQRSY